MKIFKKKVFEYEDINFVLCECSKENRKAQEYLYKTYYKYALNIAIRFAKNYDTANEIINDSFLKIFLFLSEGKKINDFKKFLKKIIINKAIDYYRSEKKLQSNISYEDYLPEIELSDNVISNLTAKEILFHLNNLPNIYRLIFVLYEIDGYSHKEISKKLGITEVNSRKNLSRAKIQLKSMLQKGGIYE